MCFEIRKAELRDLGPALALDREAFGPDAWTVMDYAAVFSENGVKKFTAVAGGKFAGFGASEWDREQNAVCLLTLAVLPEFRNRGIGSALLHAMENAFGRSEVYLYVDIENKNAIRLYRRAGYEQAGIIPSYYLNGHDALIMRNEK
ncbi:MAG: GNAT family N-acetyltransferase [Flexilinea sp.]|nr:GNAT family N-acetyltransferase [Flexilinea sp.]